MTIHQGNATETCDFWVGKFPDEDAFTEYVGEDPEYYNRIDDDDEGALSQFIEDQGQQWCDHDMMETGFKANVKSVEELVGGYSYADQYASRLAELVNRNGLQQCNAFVFVTAGQIRHPRSVTTERFDLRYVGQITYVL